MSKRSDELGGSSIKSATTICSNDEFDWKKLPTFEAAAEKLVAGVCALLLSPANLLNAIAVAVPIAIVLAGGISFYWQYRKLAPTAVQFTRPREAELTPHPRSCAVHMARGRPICDPRGCSPVSVSQLEPDSSAVSRHWGANGQPNRWWERTTKGVYGLLIFAAELCAWVLVMALAGWFGLTAVALPAYRARLHDCVRVLLCSSVRPGCPPAATPYTSWVIALLPTAILIALITVMTNKMNEVTESIDPTPNECWRVYPVTTRMMQHCSSRVGTRCSHTRSTSRTAGRRCSGGPCAGDRVRSIRPSVRRLPPGGVERVGGDTECPQAGADPACSGLCQENFAGAKSS